MTAVITFLSDYGHDDEFVGVCHGVMARIAPEARVLDVTHGIDRHDVRSGALVLRRALPYFPPGVHLAVVDPEVGGERRAVAVRTARGGSRSSSAPTTACSRWPSSASGARWRRSTSRARRIAWSRRRPPSTGATSSRRWPRTWRPARRSRTRATRSTPTSSRRCTRRSARATRTAALVAHALAFDRFGNVMLDVEHAELAGSGLKLGHRVTINDELAHYATTFADVPPGELLLYEDAYRTLALAVNRGSAALHLGLDLDAEVHIRPA